MAGPRYLFRSGYNAGSSFCEDCRPPDYPRESLKLAIAEGKRIRKYYAGNFHPLNEVSTSAEVWCVLQYHLPDRGEGMVMAFRRHRSPYGTFTCALHEIEPQADYEVTQATHDEHSSPVKMSGTALQRLSLAIDERPGSLLVEYRRIGSKAIRS
jgi:alpha-galactosidase